MKKRAIIVYFLAFTLLLSACAYRIPQETEGGSDPALQGTESTPSSSDTSPSVSQPITTPELGEFSIVSVGTEDYRYGSCYYREITLIINGQEVSGMTLYSCEEEVEEVIIPEEVNGRPVVAIGLGTLSYSAPAFSYNKSIKRVVIPETVCFIGMGAFSECSELTDLSLPASVKWIISLAFDGCPGLKEIRVTPDMKLEVFSLGGAIKLEKVILEEGVTFFPKFTDCETLTEITIPSTITHLGLDASGCDDPYFNGSAITFLEVPEGVTFMCGNLMVDSIIESIVIPTTLTDYEDSTFSSPALKRGFFRGTKEQCPQGLIHIFDVLGVPIYFLSETEPTEAGNFWHYVDGQPVIW